MKSWKTNYQWLGVLAGTALLSTLNLMSAFGAPLAITNKPLFLSETPPPLNLLVMSRDHRMYYEAYNDASDLDGDGILDTQYKTDPLFIYYGYFESTRCYNYSSGVFVPAGTASSKKCSGSWSGDWLNYVTMSRMDALRKVLYGGLRSTDTATQTVLQRAFIPQDAHSWGKEYRSVAENGYDIRDYTPLALPTGTNRHLFANTTPLGSAATTGNANAAINGVGLPLFRVLQNRNNRIWDWLSAERLVANNEIHQGATQGGITPTDYVVRVQVCSAGSFDSSDPRNNCRTYSSGNAKPTGLLQDYGENDSMMFGLLSGSYGKPHDGGVLRKGVASLKDEVDLTNGVFVYSLPKPGIINTIDRLRITSFNSSQAYDCGWITDSSDAAGRCSMWGNPTAEMMYEVARYYAGKTSATGAFTSGANNAEETGIGLSVANWDASSDPYKTFPRCARPFETVISDISPSYDSDKVPGSVFTGYSGDISMNAGSIGQKIWDNEIGASKKIFIGDNGSLYDGAPTAKVASSFGNIRGLSPEAPTKEGSYNAASVAYYSLTNDLNPASSNQKMKTFAVALASPLPSIPIKVNGHTVTMVPFAKSVGGNGISAARGSYQPTNQIVDFYVDTLTPTYGKFRVNFEDVEQGADHDMDAIAIYEYQVTGGDVRITVTSEYAAGGIMQHMGYVISGVSDTKDGVYLVVRDVDTAAGSDPDYYLDVPPGKEIGVGWNDGVALPAGTGTPSVRVFTPDVNSVAAGTLKDPLWYAAKWGGFDDEVGSTKGNGLPDVPAKWDADGDSQPDNYFLVTSALKLKDQLSLAFKKILGDTGTASSAAVSSGSISDSTSLYQAYFDPKNWSGNLSSFAISNGDSNGDGVKDNNDIKEGRPIRTIWDASAQVPAPASRNILTIGSTLVSGTTGVLGTGLPFTWTAVNGDSTRRSQLNRSDSLGSSRLDFLRGVRINELPGGVFRQRGGVLGDIINSAPIYVGEPAFGYKDNFASKPYSTFVRDYSDRGKTIYAGANDGMLHAFDAATGTERFAFVPGSVFANLYRLTAPSYDHQYYVDGTPTIADAFVNSDWRTVLVSGLNKGGQSVFALDVTRPEAISQATAGSTVMWEFTDKQDADLGYTYSRPAVVKLKNGKWAAVFGNGYNNTETMQPSGDPDTSISATGNAVLFIVDIETGKVMRKIDTGVGKAQDPKAQSRPNGLATPALVDLDGDRIPDYAYAGDLFGNMWKFDLTAVAATTWDVAYRTGGVALPLFKAVDGAGIAQPITERPTVRLGYGGVGAVVLFGTGKFLESDDRNIASLKTQSFYGIYDRNSGTAGDIVSGRSTLVQQTITGEGSGTLDGSPVRTRATSSNPVNLSTQNGWYIDLLGPRGFEGEMQITNPVLRNGRVIFTTLIPDTDVCAYGGRSWLMEMNAMDGTRPSPFKTLPNDNGIASDAIMSTPGVISSETSDYLEVGNTSGKTETIQRDPGPGAIGRQSWRQLR